MPNILAAGAGANEGLQSYLLRLLREKQVADQEARTAEEVRSNKAHEGLTSRQIDETSALRKSNQDLLAHQRELAQANTERDDMRASLNDVMPGVMITPEVRNKAVSTGAALPSKFKDVVPFGDDFVGPLSSEAGLEGPKRGEVTAYTLQGKKPDTEYNREQKTYVVNGKPVDAVFDPRTLKVTSMTGEDITDKVGHYEKPTPDAYSPVQSGGNYIRFDRRTGKFLDDSGNEVANPTLATTGSTRTMGEGATMLRRNVPDLQAQAAELNKRGLFGPVMSKIRDLGAKFGTSGEPEDVQRSAQAVADAINNDPALNQDELVGQFATTLALMTSGAGRVHGGARGGGSIQMIDYLKSVLSANGSLSMFNGRLRALDSFLKHYEEGTGGGAGGTEKPGGGSDIYDEYLKRHAQTPK